MRLRLMAATALVPVLAACGGGSAAGPAPGPGTQAAGGGGVAAASCVAPTLTVTPATVHADDRVQVSGEWFADGCNDVAVNGQEPQAPPPFTDMTLEVLQGDRSWPVASGVDAEGEHYSFTASIDIPREIHTGKATVQAKGRGLPADIEVVG